MPVWVLRQSQVIMLCKMRLMTQHRTGVLLLLYKTVLD